MLPSSLRYSACVLPLSFAAALASAAARAGVVTCVDLLGRGRRERGADEETASFFRCRVRHWRHAPVEDSLDYEARWALVDITRPPTWWARRRVGSLDAKAALAFVKPPPPPDATVLLLCQPQAANYAQNPIAVYYVLGARHELVTCIAEVTNTPWGDAVVFQFDPNGDELPDKPLHVSPFTPMHAKWTLRTSVTPQSIRLLVTVVEHGQSKPLLTAVLEGTRDEEHPHTPNEHLPLRAFVKYAYAPQRIACWIYAHAVHLVLRKGLRPFDAPAIKRTLAAVGGTACPMLKQTVPGAHAAAILDKDRPIAWRCALTYPWDHAHRCNSGL